MSASDDPLPSPPAAFASYHSRHRTTPEERRILARAFPEYDAMDPNSDARKKLTNELCQTLLSGSPLWTRDRVMQWMRNTKRKLKDQTVESPVHQPDQVPQQQFAAFAPDFQARLGYGQIQVRPLAPRIHSVEISPLEAMRALENTLVTGAAVLHNDLVGIQAEMAATHAMIVKVFTSLQNQVKELADLL
jgi:hypothetical protein